VLRRVLPAQSATCSDPYMLVPESLAAVSSGDMSSTEPPSALLVDALGTTHATYAAVLRLLLLAASAISFQVRAVVDGCPTTIASTIPPHLLFGGSCMSLDVAVDVRRLLQDVFFPADHSSWSTAFAIIASTTMKALPSVVTHASASGSVGRHSGVWLACAVLSLIQQESVAVVNVDDAARTGSSETSALCENHQDGVTAATWTCECCATTPVGAALRDGASVSGPLHLCDECDGCLHRPLARRGHARNAVRNALLEPLLVKASGDASVTARSGYLQLSVFPAQGKSTLEIKASTSKRGGSVGAATSCRFCERKLTSANRRIAADGGFEDICTSEDCLQLSEIACAKTLSCGHHCCGVLGEQSCLPCGFGCPNGVGFDGSDYCGVCYTEALVRQPCLSLACGHVFHAQCLKGLISAGYSTAAVSFGFLNCPSCRVILGVCGFQKDFSSRLLIFGLGAVCAIWLWCILTGSHGSPVFDRRHCSFRSFGGQHPRQSPPEAEVRRVCLPWLPPRSCGDCIGFDAPDAGTTIRTPVRSSRTQSLCGLKSLPRSPCKSIVTTCASSARFVVFVTS
jgi:Ring finger domain